MVSLLPAGIPLSNAYDFIGKPNHVFGDDDLVSTEASEKPTSEVPSTKDVTTEPLEELIRNLADCVDNDALNTLADCLNTVVKGIEVDTVDTPQIAQCIFITLWTVKSEGIESAQKEDCKKLVKQIIDKVNCLTLDTLKADYQSIKKSVLECVKEEVKEPETPKKGKPSKPVVKEELRILPSPQEEAEEETSEPVLYVELNYEDIDSLNPYKSLPESESGNYILVYSTAGCISCERLIDSLKGNTDCPVVRIKCKSSVKDLYYERTIRSFPSWLTIKNNKVAYYGYGFMSVEGFARLFK